MEAFFLGVVAMAEVGTTDQVNDETMAPAAVQPVPPVAQDDENQEVAAPPATALGKILGLMKKVNVLEGKGDEEDTLRARTIYVYDTSLFPFRAFFFCFFVFVFVFFR